MMEIRHAKVKLRGPSRLIRLGERVGPIKEPGSVHDDSRYREKNQGIGYLEAKCQECFQEEEELSHVEYSRQAKKKE